MERHQCKLCSRSFFNGKALGGHMRSHLLPLQVPPKLHQLGGELTESTSSLHSFKYNNKEVDECKDLIYGLRENPKKSYKLVDPHFLETGSGLFVQDSESETESIRSPTWRRSTRRMVEAEYSIERKHKLKKFSSTESVTELEVVSSVCDDDCSDSLGDEDVASCLMMLAKDKWRFKPPSQTRESYKCETCKMVFDSSQALGGHRTSHNKVKKRLDYRVRVAKEKSWEEKPRKKIIGKKNVSKKIMHECPVCFRVFGSGQALGGHKRSHFLGSSSTTASSTSPKQQLQENGKNFEIENNNAHIGFSFIDLNLPAPMEYEDL